VLRALVFFLLVAAARAQAATPGELVSAELIVQTAATRRYPVPLEAVADCPQGGSCLRGAAGNEDLGLSFSLGPGKRALPFEVEVSVRRPFSAKLISLALTFAADGFVPLGRDYVPTPAARAILDRYDPKWISLVSAGSPVAGLIVDADVDAVSVRSQRGTVTVELELFSVPARPFGHLPRCGKVWREIRGRVVLPSRFLHKGDRLVGSGELVMGATAPVALSPWPDGRAAAFVITDHADQTSYETLHALLGGRSDADLDHPTAGLLAHHIPITKALFLRGSAKHGHARPQLEDARVQVLAERMRAAGSELVPHSATPVRDSREVVNAALEWFASRGSHVWIDHQPQTNCEGFCQGGWRTRTGIADLLDRHGVRDLWDLSEWDGRGLDERDPRHLDRRAPTLWPLGRLEADGPASLWMFRSTWAFVPQRSFYARYDGAALDRLERDRGIHIAHTYLETLHARGTFLGRRNLVFRMADGRVALSPAFETLLASLERRQARGSLWVAPIGEVARRLRELSQARLRITEAGKLGVSRPGAIDGLTLHLGGGLRFASSRGLSGQRALEGGQRAWVPACKQALCTTELEVESADGRSGALLR